MRYLYHAFFARPQIPLLGWFPWNAVAMAAAAVGGFFDPAIWLGAGAMEFVYLFTLASNDGFQRSIDERRTAAIGGDDEAARRNLLAQLGGNARQRYVKLEQKREKLEKVYRDAGSDDLLFDSNVTALKRLTWLYLKLLVGQRNLVTLAKENAADLQPQIDAVERELAAGVPTEAVRHSKEATLRLLRERINNLSSRDTSLAEIESDLQRIEAQIDVALDEASLRGRPTAVSADVRLTSSLLDNFDDPTTYSSTPRELQ